MMRFKKGSRADETRLGESTTEVPERPAPKRQGTMSDRQKAAEEREKNEQAAIAELEKLRQKRCGRTVWLRELRLGQEGSHPDLVKPRSAAVDPPHDHKFRIGQKVALATRPLDGSAVQDCEVSRLLPADNTDRLDVRYRIREIGSGRERVVKESELADGAASGANNAGH